jgi:hypothetical protein
MVEPLAVRRVPACSSNSMIDSSRILPCTDAQSRLSRPGGSGGAAGTHARARCCSHRRVAELPIPLKEAEERVEHQRSLPRRNLFHRGADDRRDIGRVEFRDARSADLDRRDVGRRQPERLGLCDFPPADGTRLSTAAGNYLDVVVLSAVMLNSRPLTVCSVRLSNGRICSQRLANVALLQGGHCTDVTLISSATPIKPLRISHKPSQ